MPFFIPNDDLVVENVGNRKWKVIAPLTYLFSVDGIDQAITVPVGYVTDFASVPRLFWVMFPPDGKYTKAAVIHDYLCDNPKKFTHTRKQTDYIFLTAMLESGVSRLKSFILFSAVRFYAIVTHTKY